MEFDATRSGSSAEIGRGEAGRAACRNLWWARSAYARALRLMARGPLCRDAVRASRSPA
jgi:hypothetical protein